ncbi:MULTISPECIES: hypothetical protein [Microbacterium]|uniref:RCC1-like domain-containing protein n=1 Tax=Microbacterium hominis TaxID=162426 RepID=A0A2K9D9G8_9MICO|nr:MULTISPECIES: hypothetical protein [Microbacterium]AUG29522.1 hypothetical protein CXR34_08725 [Microbacterium hominis]EPD84221.1 hypothetical protein HMPREF1529_02286 [Microbacterium sp. oral taxon 186 str. F0373]
MISSHTHRSRFLSRLRGLASDDRGASQPLLLLGAVVVFAIISMAFGGGLQSAMTSMQQQKVNGELASTISATAMREAAKGYTALSALPTTTDISVNIAGTAVQAQRSLTLNTATSTATVTVSAPKYAGGKWGSIADCSAAATNCVSATETSTLSMSETFPKVKGISMLDGSANIADSSELNWKDVAVGDGNAVAIDRDGKLWTWGANANGEAGRGGTGPVNTPAALTGLTTTFRSVAAGANSMYAIDEDGHLWSWGLGSNGRLGNGSSSTVTKPKITDTSTEWLSVSAGASHACAIDTNGGLYCWGSAAGKWRAGTVDASVPTRIIPTGETPGSAASTRFTSVAVGGTHQLAVDDSGVVYSWGQSESPALGLGSTTTATAPTKLPPTSFGAAVVSVSASLDTSFAIDAYGRLYGWGANGNGQLGNGDNRGAGLPVRAASNLLIRSVSSNGATTLAVTRSGELYSWGANSNRVLGDGSIGGRTLPGLVVDASRFDKVLAAGNSGWAIDTTNRLWFWGEGSPGLWGTGDAEAAPRDFATQNRIRSNGGATVTAVAVGSAHTVTLGDDGTVWSFGAAFAGQLGNNSTALPATGKVVKASASYSEKASSVTAGNGFVIVGGRLGTTVGSGVSSSGQLGVTSSTTSPKAVAGSYSSVAAGGRHVVAITRDTGRVVAWGANDFGQLGNGTRTSSAAPVEVQGLPTGVGFVDVAAGDDFSMALAADGTVWTWGRNNSGQLGDGSTIDRDVAGNVLATQSVVQIGAGAEHALAVAVDPVRETQAIFTWGKNAGGQLGIGDQSAPRTVPVAIGWPSSTPVVAVDGGADSSTLLTATGKLYSWGANPTTNGLGRPALTPTEMPGLTAATFIAIDATASHTVALDNIGDVWAWGDVSGGRAGSAASATPTKVLSGRTVVAVAAGTTNTIAVSSTGAVWVTGSGAEGQLGRGSTTDAADFTTASPWATTITANSPAYAKSGPVRFASIAAGGSNTAAIDSNGHLWMWGAGLDGMNGLGTNTNSLTAALVSSAARFTSVSVGLRTVLATTSDGAVWAWGSGINAGNGRTFDTRLPQRMSIVGSYSIVAAGAAHGVAVSRDGATAFSWGANESKQLGTPTASTSRITPFRSAVQGIIAAVAGTSFTALQSTSGMTTWGPAPWPSLPASPGQSKSISGSGGAFALVTGASALKTYGVDSSAPTAVVFTNVATSTRHVAALDVNGSVWTWGMNTSGELGRDSAAPSAMVTTIGDSNRTVFSPQMSATRITTTWPIARISASAPRTFQVNVDANMPLLSIVFDCEDGNRYMTPAVPSSGDFDFANVTLPDAVAGCTAPVMSAVLDGAPLRAADVKVVLAPLVYATGAKP